MTKIFQGAKNAHTIIFLSTHFNLVNKLNGDFHGDLTNAASLVANKTPGLPLKEEKLEYWSRQLCYMWWRSQA